MSRGEFRPLQAEPTIANALHAVLSGPSPARHKVLTVLCPQHHVLGVVYRTTAGLVLLHQTEGVHKERDALEMPGVGPVELPPQRGPRADRNAYLLHDGDGQTFPMQCRCHTATPRHDELRNSISKGARKHRVS